MTGEMQAWLDDLYTRSTYLYMEPVYTHMYLMGKHIYRTVCRHSQKRTVEIELQSDTLKELLEKWEEAIGEIERRKEGDATLVPSKSQSKRLSVQRVPRT